MGTRATPRRLGRIPLTLVLLTLATLAALVAAGLAEPASAASSSASRTSRADEQDPEDQLSPLSFEVFRLGAGLRLYVSPRVALTVTAERPASAGDGSGAAPDTMAVNAGLVFESARLFYDWRMYGAAGASYRLPTRQWVPFMAVGGQFEIFFLEYSLPLWPLGDGSTHYGIRVRF